MEGTLLLSDTYRRGPNSLLCEGLDVRALAMEHGTPLYVYSANAIRDNARIFKLDLPEDTFRFRYAVKANSNPEILKLLGQAGFGMDVVSSGELRLCLEAGIAPDEIVFSGSGKDESEIEEALVAGVGYLSIESEYEIEQVAGLLAQHPDSLSRFLIRCNPDVGGGTHPFMITGTMDNKFGIPAELVAPNYRSWSVSLLGRLDGLHFHIGSGIKDMSFFEAAAEIARSTTQSVREHGGEVKTIDFGGGVGVYYDSDEKIDWQPYKQTVRKLQSECNVTIILEPGKSVIAETGILVGKVLNFKKGRGKDFVILNAGMNDLIRPALYDAHHEVVALYEGTRETGSRMVDIVGPICESSDFFGKNRSFPSVQPGDFVAILTAGAYGYSMSSTYNERLSPAELLIDGDQCHLIRARGASKS